MHILNSKSMKSFYLFFILQVISIPVLLSQQKNDNSMEQHINYLISRMTLEEKASLCSGRDSWSTKAIDSLEIPSIWLSDGPHGLRRAPSTDKGGYGDQLPATCFPTASALASTWDTELIYKVGQAIGEECQALNVNVLLGPGINIKRHPLGGRNFEFMSEDPILAGEMGAAMINGIQSQDVGTSLKHYALNNEETDRMVMNSEADERTMREIYLLPFEIAVKKSQPWTVMASYNRINGIYGTENFNLLTNVLRNEFGFKGLVISDWVSVVERVDGLKAGMNLEMPGSEGVNDALIVKAVKTGQLDEKILDENVKQILRLVFKAKSLQKSGVDQNTPEHHKLARQVAAEAVTLLKNTNQILPISSKYKTIAIIGEFAKNPRYQGNGSSEVKPVKIDTFYNEMHSMAGKKYKIVYAPGYNLTDDNDISRIEDAKTIAKSADLVLICAGLPLSYESEGIDRKHINLPPSQDKLISELAKVNKNTVVLLSNGSAVAMPWNKEVNGIVETWLAGQAGAGGIADVLFGKVNPSGKLAETFPVRLEDTPAFLNFPGEERNVLYGERIYVGYRYYDIKKVEPLFPFGYGLSYTSFEYSNLNIANKTFTDKDSVTVSLTLKNSGACIGKEVIELYVRDVDAALPRPEKELKKFSKIELKPGETKEVSFVLNKRDFSYFSSRLHNWVAESGDFEILIGASSRDIRLKGIVSLNSAENLQAGFDLYSFFYQYWTNPKTRNLTFEYFGDWIMEFAKTGQTIDQVSLDPFLTYQPVIKMPYITKGKITREKVEEFVSKAQQLDKQ
jgi:beta-glucosidase